MTDDLETKTAQELDEIFAREIAGWKATECSSETPFDRGGYRLPNTFDIGARMIAWWHPTNPDHPGAYVRPPRFSTDEQLTQPWLKKHQCVSATWTDRSWQVTIMEEVGEGETFDMPTIGEADDESLATAATLALIRAARAKKP